jgi:hypothetical protein
MQMDVSYLSNAMNILFPKKITLKIPMHILLEDFEY